MGKRYLEELAAWAKERAPQKRQQDAAVVAFVAVKSDVEHAIAAGYALTTIWAHMRETAKVRCSYETFRKHVHRFITTPASHQTVSSAVPPSAPKKPSRSSHRKAGGIPGFQFNPIPNDEDLF